MLEITNDLQLLPPIMFATLVAKWVGDLFTHSLYDKMLGVCLLPPSCSSSSSSSSPALTPLVPPPQVKYIPFLENDPPRELDKMIVSDIMVQPVCTLPLKAAVRDVLGLLMDPVTKHNGFPV